MRMRNLIPWRDRNELVIRPEEPIPSVERQMNRLFNEFARGLEFPVLWDSEATFAPCVDVVETDTNYRVMVDLPGLEEKDIDLTLTPNALSIRGEKKVETEVKDEHYYRQERHYGVFTRIVPLPTDNIDQEKIEAIFKNGVLTINLLKLPEVQKLSKHIPVQVK